MRETLLDGRWCARGCERESLAVVVPYVRSGRAEPPAEREPNPASEEIEVKFFPDVAATSAVTWKNLWESRSISREEKRGV